MFSRAPTPTTADLADATPPDRDRVVDLVRVAALVVVVVGHWLMAVVTWDHHGLRGRNVLDLEPWTRWLTWALQVMPLFFVAGGVANAASWASAQRRHAGYPAWLYGRVDRLLRPVAALCAAWTIGLVLARGAGADARSLHVAARLVGMPLWFLAVYVGVVAAAPAMLAAHRRWSVRVLMALAVAVAAVDALALGRHWAWLGWANFGFVWVLVHQFGFFWRDRSHRGSGPARRDGWLLVLGGFGALVALTHWLGYPVSMVGGASDRSNNTPPTLALVALGLGQTGLLLLARDRLTAWLARPRPWRTVVAANGVAMTLYLWHLTALCAAALLLVRTGVFPSAPVGTTAWWWARPAWLLVLALLLLPLLALWSRVEQAVGPPVISQSGRGPVWQSVAGAALVSLGLTGVALLGFWVPGRAAGWTLASLLAVVAGHRLAKTSLLHDLSGRAGGRARRRGGGSPSGARAVVHDERADQLTVTSPRRWPAGPSRRSRAARDGFGVRHQRPRAVRR